ncbi:MAG: diguanylate cyclase domain-containing protein [Microthrixaceae bacterium]
MRCGLGTVVLAVAALAALLVRHGIDDGAGLGLALGLLLAGVLGGGALWWWGVHTARHHIDEPIERLRRTVAAAGRGELEVRSGLSGGTDVAALGTVLDGVLALAQDQVVGLAQQAEWGAQVRMIFEALDLADDEAAAHQVVREALAMLDPARPMEMLLAPPDSTELLPVAVNPGAPAPCCPVTDLDGCVAVRRSQTVVFESSHSINSCPKLKDRPGGACSAVCVPVSVGGRAVGALHATGPDRHPPGQVTADKLATLSTQVGNRLGALRALESSRTEAATDPLTGLPNRRTLEARLEQLLERGVPFVLVVADLDHFKAINSGHGLETGDRALATFAAVLRDKVRGNDLVARYGGEEFVLVYPEMAVGTSVEAIERIRDGLAEAITLSGIPWFTCSFGITHSGVGSTPEAVIRVANAGLERAKALGRDQAVYADAALADEVFGPER